MRRLLIITCLLNSGFAFGQIFSYPKIDVYGKSITHFIPRNWILLDSTIGDLNGDQINDFALVIQSQDSVSLIKVDNNFSDTVITQPRILIVAFYDANTRQYKLVEQSNTFILNHDNPNMEEPFQDISISKGILTIDFQIFMNMGGWGTSTNSYKFQYRNKEFVLIGADDYSFQRNTGESENRSYNFLTKKLKIEIGNISSESSKIKWRNFKTPKLKTLKTFIQPFTWEVEKDYYL
jgi:hypothetical protein